MSKPLAVGDTVQPTDLANHIFAGLHWDQEVAPIGTVTAVNTGRALIWVKFDDAEYSRPWSWIFWQRV